MSNRRFFTIFGLIFLTAGIIATVVVAFSPHSSSSQRAKAAASHLHYVEVPSPRGPISCVVDDYSPDVLSCDWSTP